MPTRAFSTSLSPLLIDKASCVGGDGQFPPGKLKPGITKTPHKLWHCLRKAQMSSLLSPFILFGFKAKL